MDELHPLMCHIILGCGIGIMNIFNYITTNVAFGTCNVIEEGHVILEF
jgi:hypothetical protein